MAKTIVIPKSGPARVEEDGVPTIDDLEQLARWMDSLFQIPGLKLRFGFDALLGLLPGLGDTATCLVSLYILNAANQLGVPKATQLRMASNVAIDYLIGAIPLAGDMFDLVWKSNLRNVELLRKFAAANPNQRRRMTWTDRLFVGALIAGLVGLLIGSVAFAYFVIASVGGALVRAFQ